jgi:hypothetical protein
MVLRNRGRRVGAVVSAVAVLFGGVLTSEPAHAETAAAVSMVGVNSANSADITATATGAATLQEFARNVAAMSPETAAKTPDQMQADYRVLQVDMEQVRSRMAPGGRCAGEDGAVHTQDLLIAPREATGIRYVSAEHLRLDTGWDPSGVADRCDVDVMWDEPHTGDPNDDTGVGANARPYEYRYASDCFARKKHYKVSGDLKIYMSWNDGCYANYVVRHDGNQSWNYYTVKSMSSCKNVQAKRLKSCGHGVKQNQAQNNGRPQWDDWAPIADSVGDCRTRSISVSAGPISVSSDYTHCEEQKIYKYAEAGKMSSYWKGKRDNTRGTQHQISVKYPQSAGRPHWTHWLNSDACLCLGIN